MLGEEGAEGTHPPSWQRSALAAGDGAGHFPAAGNVSLLLLLQDKLEQQGTCKGAKRRKSVSKMQRLGEMLRKVLLLPSGKVG